MRLGVKAFSVVRMGSETTELTGLPQLGLIEQNWSRPDSGVIDEHVSRPEPMSSRVLSSWMLLGRGAESQ